MQVDGELGLANPERRFLNRFCFEHVSGREGKTESTHAMVLIPTEEEAGLNATLLAEATMFKSGMCSNVLVPSHFVSCSKKKGSPYANKFIFSIQSCLVFSCVIELLMILFL